MYRPVVAVVSALEHVLCLLCHYRWDLEVS